MIKGIFQNMTTKGKGMLALSITSFTLYALAGTAMMLLGVDMMKMITSGREVALSHY